MFKSSFFFSFFSHDTLGVSFFPCILVLAVGWFGGYSIGTISGLYWVLKVGVYLQKHKSSMK